MSTQDTTAYDKLRLEEIDKHSRAATAELRQKIKDDPLETNFTLYSGCPNVKIAKEVAHRFKQQNISSEVNVSVWGTITIKVVVDLPQSLIHD